MLPKELPVNERRCAETKTFDVVFVAGGNVKVSRAIFLGKEREKSIQPRRKKGVIDLASHGLLCF